MSTKHLNSKIGSMEYDKLIAGLTPPTKVVSGTITKLAAAGTYPRGTVLAKSTKDGKLYILGTTAAEGDTLTPDCVLCDDTEVGTAGDENAAVYVQGCINIDAVTVKSGYTITEADKDKLRERGIFFGKVLD